MWEMASNREYSISFLLIPVQSAETDPQNTDHSVPVLIIIGIIVSCLVALGLMFLGVAIYVIVEKCKKSTLPLLDHNPFTGNYTG